MTRRSPNSLKKYRAIKRISMGWDAKRAYSLPRMPIYKNPEAIDWEGIFNKVWEDVNRNER